MAFHKVQWYIETKTTNNVETIADCCSKTKTSWTASPFWFYLTVWSLRGCLDYVKTSASEAYFFTDLKQGREGESSLHSKEILASSGQSSLHSKRFRGVWEQRKTEEWDFRYFACYGPVWPRPPAGTCLFQGARPKANARRFTSEPSVSCYGAWGRSKCRTTKIIHGQPDFPEQTHEALRNVTGLAKRMIYRQKKTI